MPNIITIPTPCHQSWADMTAKDQGRHCNACAKTVIDFTTWQPQEILFYFKKHKNICGRFTESQLNEPIPTQEDFVRELFNLPISTLKRVAAIFLFAFVIGASSCKEITTGQIVKNNIEKQDTTQKTVQGGMSFLTIRDTIPKKFVPKTITFTKPPNMMTIKGDVAIVSQPITMGEPVAVNPDNIIGDTIIVKKPICQPIKPKNDDIIMGKMVMPIVDSTKRKTK